jgi:opacity protein-like surface antigen
MIARLFASVPTAVLLLTTALPAVAEEPVPAFSGFYFGGRQVLTFQEDTGFQSGGSSFESSYDPGLRFGGMAGYDFGPMLGPVSPRIEIEGGYSNLSADEVSINGIGQGSTDSFGSLTQLSGTVNLFLDLDLASMTNFGSGGFVSRITLFIGGGVGAANVTLAGQGASSSGVVIDDDDTQLTWHVSAGLGYRFSETTTVEVGYRYSETNELSFTARDGSVSAADLRSHAMTIGIRRGF